MSVKKTKDQASISKIREWALASLENFIRLVHPQRELGQCHIDLIQWWNRENSKSHQLLLFPRDHGKSAMVAYRVAWEITKNPAIRVLYISSTQKLAEKQLKFIKDILELPIYRYYWPDMTNIDEGKREKWTEREISVDHPERKRQIIRDPTVFTAGLTTNIVGLHCDIAVLDDCVVDTNAYSDEGREKCASQASYLTSILGTDGRLWAVGTRYHPKDLYDTFKKQVVKIKDDEGNIVKSYELYEILERPVEDRGDGTGQFLWPKPEGKKFGFNQQILAEKQAGYSDPVKFRAQYYNDPNDLSTSSITPDMFQYYNRSLLSQKNGRWFYKDRRLNVFAAIDFAYSLSKEADYTAIVVVGVDGNNNYYVLDIDRFRSNRVSEYFDRILRLYHKWGFRKISAEVVAAQEVIVKALKEDYIREHGIALTVVDTRPSRLQGAKEQRIESVLQPKYANKQIWHYSGGNCSLLEEELLMQNPAHDDIKDSLSNAIDACVAPTSHMQILREHSHNKYYNKRFGGIG